MNKALAILTALFFMPQTAVLDVEHTQKLLAMSVLIRAKAFSVNPDTKEVKSGLIGCSGTYINPSTVLTAAHCFDMRITDIWVRGADGKSYTAKVKSIVKDVDLALLTVNKKHNLQCAQLAPSVRIGENVYNVGSPFSLEFLVSNGIVAQTNRTVPQFKAVYLITTAMINSGSSGGGAFNEAGELIGVNTMSVGGFFGWAGISMAVDRDTIATFLKDTKWK